MEKGENAGIEHFLLFPQCFLSVKIESHLSLYDRQRRDVLWDHPWRPGGRRPHSLSGAYLQDYASYGYEISWVDRSHQEGVQCT